MFTCLFFLLSGCKIYLYFYGFFLHSCSTYLWRSLLIFYNLNCSTLHRFEMLSWFTEAISCYQLNQGSGWGRHEKFFYYWWLEALRPSTFSSIFMTQCLSWDKVVSIVIIQVPERTVVYASVKWLDGIWPLQQSVTRANFQPADLEFQVTSLIKNPCEIWTGALL